MRAPFCATTVDGLSPHIALGPSCWEPGVHSVCTSWQNAAFSPPSPQMTFCFCGRDVQGFHTPQIGGRAPWVCRLCCPLLLAGSCMLSVPSSQGHRSVLLGFLLCFKVVSSVGAWGGPSLSSEGACQKLGPATPRRSAMFTHYPISPPFFQGSSCPRVWES